MVALPDIARVSELSVELATLERALRHLEAGGRIVQMVLVEEGGGAVGAPIGDRGPAILDVRRWQYPPQMVEAIKDELIRQRDEIDAELQGLGVTGVAESRR